MSAARRRYRRSKAVVQACQTRSRPQEVGETAGGVATVVLGGNRQLGAASIGLGPETEPLVRLCDLGSDLHAVATTARPDVFRPGRFLLFTPSWLQQPPGVCGSPRCPSPLVEGRSARCSGDKAADRLDDRGAHRCAATGRSLPSIGQASRPPRGRRGRYRGDAQTRWAHRNSQLYRSRRTTHSAGIPRRGILPRDAFVVSVRRGRSRVTPRRMVASPIARSRPGLPPDGDSNASTETESPEKIEHPETLGTQALHHHTNGSLCGSGLVSSPALSRGPA